MKLKFDKALSLVAIGVLSVIGTVQAAPVYEIVNIEDFDLNGTIDGTRNGYAMAVNSEDEVVGISKGKKKLSTEDIEGGIIDVEDGISDAEEITYSVLTPIEANNFTVTTSANAAEGAWKPSFYSLAGTTNPTDEDSDGELVVNSIDSFFYGLNSNGTKVGAYTGVEKTLAYEGTSTTQELWYYRDFELRAIAVKDDVEYSLLPPYTTYERLQDGDTSAATVELGGSSVAADVNDNNLVVGYGSTALVSSSVDRVDSCIASAEDTDADNPTPLAVCIQDSQYPDTNSRRYILYQTRALVWDLNNLDDTGVPERTQLPLGLTPDDDSTLIYTAQALGVNGNDDLAGRSHVYRNGDTDKLYFDAAYWKKNANGEYQYNWVDMDDDVTSSIAYDINNDGMLVGSYRKYIGGYLRDKFFTLDTNNPEQGIVTPNDFQTTLSDLSSKPKDINNKGQVVGYIESTYDKEKPRPKVGFLFDNNTSEFVNLNDRLTCGSKGYEQNTDGEWARHQVSIQDGTGEILNYNTDIQVVEANNINEDGTIVGTAFIRKPQYQTDAITGNVLVGENNLPLFELDGNGDPVTAYLPRMVILKPTSGEACNTSDAVEEEAYVRKGAASFAWLFTLPLLWLRRRVKK
ncbi:MULTISPECIES: DUF3466 family protein [Shewanella]|uniref:DUF3466 family protein n=1 Tax=Shewanella psychromarinicola TaxID=2487742 RepID=A0A3N4E074_9GAMM|nr:DUF3466 family protein [Shewanella psychromarinicola]AZG35630.1 DUF3466 family protein [Shewanella psychromarinicola]MCL1081342.1 DUF3466 family protein [Shewanella psychromarinicola]RPA27621.1 DUF3466 family protein [Shewanella psychromarinicola]